MKSKELQYLDLLLAASVDNPTFALLRCFTEKSYPICNTIIAKIFNKCSLKITDSAATAIRLFIVYNDELLAEFAKEAPGNSIKILYDYLSPEQFDYCVRKAPQDTLNNYCTHKQLTESQFNYCVSAAPAQALWRAWSRLDSDQLEKCIELAPSAALATFATIGVPLSKEQFDSCVLASPGSAFREGVINKLSREQLRYCIESAPSEAVRNPIIFTISPALFEKCIYSAPKAALEYIAKSLTQVQFDMCAEIVSEFDLVELAIKLDPEKFSLLIDVKDDPNSYKSDNLLTNDQKLNLKHLILHASDRKIDYREIDESIRRAKTSAPSVLMLQDFLSGKTLQENSKADINKDIHSLNCNFSQTCVTALSIGRNLLRHETFGVYKITKEGKLSFLRYLRKDSIVVYLFTKESYAQQWINNDRDKDYTNYRLFGLNDIFESRPKSAISIRLNNCVKDYEIFLDKDIIDCLFIIFERGEEYFFRYLRLTGKLPSREST